MFNSRKSLAIAAVVIAFGCGEKPEAPSADAEAQIPPMTAATLGEQQVLATADYLEQAPYAGADRAKGEQQAVLCRACHSFELGGTHMIGPNLHGIFGSSIGTREGFDYSEAILEADFVWTPAALDAWLSQPGQFLPGNRMTFIGVSNAQDRADLIAYLLEATEAEQ